MAMSRRESLSVAQIFGLSPARLRLSQALMALRGQEEIPPTRWGLSSVKIFKPWISFPTWLGRTRADRRVPIYNFFNRTQTPPEDGWSVRVSQVRDFRGGSLTYDSHNGTDFAVPTGTTVVAPADGRVMLLPNEFNRGGLKVLLDHGGGVVTSCNHLGAALVEVGQIVRRGEPIALSGYSGIDGFLFFPWSAPHVHFNVFLDGVHIDPFAVGDEQSMWLGGSDPVPADGAHESTYTPTAWNETALATALAACRNSDVRTRLESIHDTEHLAAELLYQTAYYPTRFDTRPHLYESRHQRTPVLSLPFDSSDFVGVYYDRG
jgi:murein DD-endopeptidase